MPLRRRWGPPGYLAGAGDPSRTASANTTVGISECAPALAGEPCRPVGSAQLYRRDADRGSHRTGPPTVRRVRLRPSIRGGNTVDPAEHRYLERAARGDPEAFDALLAPRRPALLLRIASVVGDWQEAEDALQEATWRAFRELRRLRDLDAFEGWLGRIALNAARDSLRAAVSRWRREGTPAGDLAELERALAPGPDATDVVTACGPVLAALATLPPRQRRAGGLAWVAGVPPKDVAVLLQASPDGVHALLGRARRRLGTSLRLTADEARGQDPMETRYLRVSGWRLRVDPLIDYWRRARPDLRVERVAARAPNADLAVETLMEESPICDAGQPPSPAEAVPLDGLAEAAGFDLEPFGDRLLPWTTGGRLYALPWIASLHCVVYNADLLAGAGVSPPPPDWTWDEFLAYCRRCAAAGIRPVATNMFGGDLLPYVAEQLGATPQRLDPVAEAVARMREWQVALAPLAPDTGDIWERTFYPGRAALMTTHSANPYWGFSEPENRPSPFRWGIVPMPRVRRSDPHRPHWYRSAIFVRGTAADPVSAFITAAAIFTDGPPPRGGELPAYRPPEAMQAWRADPLPCGKEVLLRMEADSPPWSPSLYALPGIREIGERMVAGTLPVEEGVRLVARAAVGMRDAMG